ncbi:(2Fe-2S)-binding protein [Pareuzebyella sediminis]|uniref:(2Fe-2S)-binding protein n=1 Tax=Pareuzebyella sediminis TaxID=2607998 RepID=UPI0011EE8C3D|nr:(2Fe-2S)-binding protein [Pareuzebyella sediminis]
MEITLTVNGTEFTRDIEPRLSLTQFLREHLDLTGTHIGCDTSGCGACTVTLNGDAVKSCTILAVQANGSEVTTIEGMAKNGEMHPIQAAFKEEHGLQCGFCTPGMVMVAADILKHNSKPSEEDIRHGLKGNFCRCTGYHNIIKSIQHAAETINK